MPSSRRHARNGSNVTAVLVDHNMEGHAQLLWGTLAAEGWLDLVSLRMVTLTEAGLPVDAPDRVVWRFAQAQQMLLLTNNRNARGVDSLGQTIHNESTPSSLPVLTVGNLERMVESEYRAQCAERLVEIALYPERYLGLDFAHEQHGCAPTC